MWTTFLRPLRSLCFCFQFLEEVWILLSEFDKYDCIAKLYLTGMKYPQSCIRVGVCGEPIWSLWQFYSTVFIWIQSLNSSLSDSSSFWLMTPLIWHNIVSTNNPMIIYETAPDPKGSSPSTIACCSLHTNVMVFSKLNKTWKDAMIRLYYRGKKFVTYFFIEKPYSVLPKF